MVSRFRLLAVVAVACGLAAAVAHAMPSEQGVDKAAFMKALNGPDSFAAGKMIGSLNPDIKSDYDLLKVVLAQGNWFYRTEASKVLAKTGNSKNQQDMLESLTEKGEKNAMVRQGMAIAVAKMNDRSLYPRLFDALNDKDPRVRREVANVLRINKDKGSIEALIARWKNHEKDPIVINYIRATLEDITKRFMGADPVDWFNWWEAVKDRFEVGSSDEEALKKAEEEGKKLTDGGTTVRDVELTFSSRGIGAPVIVLPEYGFSKDFSVPFFYEIEKAAKLYYMALPKITSFKGLKQIAGRNYYPIDQLVDAFDEFRKNTKSEKIAIIASGLNTWIAMKFASKYPQRVLCMVLIDPISSDEEIGKGLDRIIKKGQDTGDIELWHWALTQRFNPQSGGSSHDEFHKEKNLPVPEGEQSGISRKGFASYFAEQQDAFVDYLYGIHLDWPGDCAIPDFNLTKEPKVQIPVLICRGKHALRSSEVDTAAIAKFYGAQVAVFERSGSLPMVEDPEKLNKTVVAFLSRFAKKATKSDRDGK
jgi:pimeloyl-ACP methyl ester carboxylesterase